MLATLTTSTADISELIDYSSPKHLLTALKLLPEIKALYEGGNMSAGVLYLDITRRLPYQLSHELTAGVYSGAEATLIAIAEELSGLLT